MIIDRVVLGAGRVDIAESLGVTGSALAAAIERDEPGVVEALLQGGADPNALDDRSPSCWRGWTPLTIASEQGNQQIAKTLLAAGADVNARNSNGETALMLAAEAGAIAVAQELIGAGADASARNAEGVTAMEFAAKRGDRRDTFNLLRSMVDEAGADAREWVDGQGGVAELCASVAALDPKFEPEGASALSSETRLLRLMSEADFFPGVLEKLMAAGVDVDEAWMAWEQDEDGEYHSMDTALHFAARSGMAKEVDVLLRAGADPEKLGGGSFFDEPSPPLEGAKTEEIKRLIEARVAQRERDALGKAVEEHLREAEAKRPKAESAPAQVAEAVEPPARRRGARL